MGQILERVLALLRSGGFLAEAAYPGRMFPRLAGFGAAVHLHKTAQGAVTVSVTVLCPADLGGAACEQEALKVLALLTADGAACVQNGCRFLGVEQVFAVEVLGTYTQAEPPGFTVHVDGVQRGGAVSVTAEELDSPEELRSMGESLPWDIAPGGRSWKLRLEERVPAQQWVPEGSGGSFSLVIATPLGQERYRDCRWCRVRREFSGQAVHQVWEGIALSREVVANG